MKCKYLPRNVAGKEVGLEGRIVGIFCGSILTSVIPIYLSIDIRNYVFNGDKTFRNMDEAFDMLKILYYCTRYKRFPEVQ